jgi:hypothetical protein
MPTRKAVYELVVPEWISGIEDACLREVIMEALVARFTAVQGGAELHAPCASALRSADSTMDQIRFGKYKGTPACRKAATAVRKYNTASECAHPTATRRSRKSPR